MLLPQTKKIFPLLPLFSPWYTARNAVRTPSRTCGGRVPKVEDFSPLDIHIARGTWWGPERSCFFTAEARKLLVPWAHSWEPPGCGYIRQAAQCMRSLMYFNHGRPFCHCWRNRRLRPRFGGGGGGEAQVLQ